jgi:DNA primase
MLAPQEQAYQGDSPDNTYGFRRCCEAIRQAVPIEEVARRYTDLEPLGGRAWFDGRCPLPDHQDKTPSLYIYPPGRFYCYGCGRGGDVVDSEFHCGDYGKLWEAMISLAVDYGVELPERPRPWHRKRERQEPVRDAIAQARFDHLRRRLFRRFFKPSLLRIEDREERKAEAVILWEATEPLADMLLERLAEAGS